MKKIAVVVDRVFQNNNLFNLNSSLNRDNCLLQYAQLKKKLIEINIDLSTHDINKVEEARLVIFLNAPTRFNNFYKNALRLSKKIIIIENEHFDIHKANRNINKLRGIRKVFSYRDFIYNNGIKLNYSFDFSNSLVTFESKEKQLLSCMISNNKLYNIENELYSERRRVITWFDENHEKDFLLYGGDWDTIVLKSNFYLNKIFNRLKIKGRKLKVYKGNCKNKSEVLSKCRFSFCFENSITPGWITEKLFDVMINCCVPIYFGPSDIKKYVPSNTYIDYEDFHSMEDLYGYLKQMNENVYQEYISNIETFLKSIDSNFPFHIDYHNKVLLDFINKEI